MHFSEKPVVFTIWLIALAGFSVFNYFKLLSGPKQGANKERIRKLWAIVPFIYIVGVSWAGTFIPPVPGSGKPDLHETGRLIWAAILVLGPPLYFFAEAVWIYGDGHGSDEQYKATQDLSSKVWIAVSTVLGLYWFHNKLG